MAIPYSFPFKLKNFAPSDDWNSFQTIDLHTCGEPLRVITKGLPTLEGNHILEYRRYIRDKHDSIRQVLMNEPRGHADMYGCYLVPPNDDGADFGIIFIHNAGYSTMCGHAIIGIATLAVEMGWVPIESPITRIVIDAPCGRIIAFAKIKNSKVENVSFLGVPSFVLHQNQTIDIDGLGTIQFDIAYGGAFYAYINSDAINLSLGPDNISNIILYGKKIKQAIIESNLPITHPFEEDLSFLYGVIFMGGPLSSNVDSRNVCVFADGEVDRCPTGSGVSGRMPLHFFKNEIQQDQVLKIESIIGSVFEGEIHELTNYGPHKAVIPKVTGTAHITGFHQFVKDPKDYLKNGFLLR